MPKISQATRLKTREDLLAAAYVVFTSKGIKNMTIRSVAKRAKCAVGVIYNYFPDKEALLLELAIESLIAFGRDILLSLKNEGDRADLVKGIINVTRSHYGPGRSNAPLLTIIFESRESSDGDIDKRITGHLIKALIPVADKLSNIKTSSEDLVAEVLSIMSFAFGLVFLEGSGQVSRLKISSDKILEAYLNGID